MPSTAVTPGTAPAGAGRDEVMAGRAHGLADQVGRIVDLDVDQLGEAQIRQLLAAEEQAIRRLKAHQSRLSATLTRRRAAQARAEHPDDPRAPERAARQVRSEMTDGLGITPSQAKRITRTGRQLEHLPATAAAHADGRLTDGHVRVIDEVTAHFSGDERREFEAQLVALADDCRDAVVFGRRARGLLIERDHDAAMADLERKKARRSGRVTQTQDGRTLLQLESAGYDGELVHTVVDAFRTPDGAGHHRSAEQRTHDAIIAAFETALRAGAASTQHGVRPQVAVVVRAESIDAGEGAAGTRWSGPLPYDELARIMGDCALTRIVADAADTPMSVSRQVRTVPAGLWQGLVLRDGGCIWEDCDAPPGWCQVAHLETPYRDFGRLSPDTAGLLCTAGPNHHAIFDNGPYEVRWVDGRPQVCTTDGQPVRNPLRDRWAAGSSEAPGGDDADPGEEHGDGADPPDPEPPTLFAREHPARYRPDPPRLARPPGTRAAPRPYRSPAARTTPRPAASPATPTRGP